MKSRAVTFLAAMSAVGAFAQSGDWRTQMDRGNILFHRGDYREALLLYEGAAGAAERSGSEPLHLASSLNALGLVYDELAQPLPAEQNYGRALAIVEKEAGLRSVGRAQILVNMSGVSLRQGRYAKGEEMLREAIDIYATLLPPGATLLAAAKDCLSEALMRRGAYQEAETMVTEALAVFEKEPETDDGNLGMTINDLGSVRWLAGRHEEATALFERAVAVLEGERRTQNPMMIYPLINLGSAYLEADRNGKAAGAFQRALRIAERCLGTDHPVYATVMLDYARSLSKTGHKGEAKKLTARARAVLKDSQLKNGTGMTVDVTAFRGR